MLHFPEKSKEKPSDLQNFGLRTDIYAKKHPKVHTHTHTSYLCFRKLSVVLNPEGVVVFVTHSVD